MAITFTQLTAGGSGANASSYNTASVSPGANKLILVIVERTYASGGSTVSTGVSGAGLTFDLVDGSDSLSVNDRNVSIWRAMSASPSSGAITINFPATVSHCFWRVIEVDGVNTSGTNGDAAIVQAVVGSISGTATPSVTLAAFADAVNNAAFGVFATSANTTFTPGSGFTEIGSDQATSSPPGTIGAQYQIGQATTVDATFGASGQAVGVALEIDAGVGGGGEPVDLAPGAGSMALAGSGPSMNFAINIPTDTV